MTQTVVIIGASSFVGAHLVRAFAAAGWRVLATHSRALEDYDGIQRQRLDAVAGLARFARLDIRDGAAVAALVAAEKPAVWVHHGGYATDYGSPDYPLMDSLSVNVSPLAALYPALAQVGCGVLVSGSSMEYGASDSANREDEACWPDTPYGLSKLAETLVARQLSLRYGVPTRVARIYLPFGPQDNPRKLMSQVVEGLATGRKVPLSPCRQRRDFMGVGDLARGFLALAGDLSRGGFDVFNLCSGQPTMLADLLLALAGRMGADRELLDFGAIPMRPGESEISYGDNAKAARLLNWQAGPLNAALDTLLA